MSSPSRSWQSPTPWQPSADVYRTRDGWVLKFDLAGVRADEVTVSIRGRRVCVSGVRRDTVVEELRARQGARWHSTHFTYDAASRVKRSASFWKLATRII